MSQMTQEQLEAELAAIKAGLSKKETTEDGKDLEAWNKALSYARQEWKSVEIALEAVGMGKCGIEDLRAAQTAIVEHKYELIMAKEDRQDHGLLF